MKLKPEEARNVVYDDHEDWEEVEKNTDGHGRWDIYWEGVFKHLPTGRFYRFYWSVGSTEQQDTGAYEYDTEDVLPIEIQQVEKLVKVWERVPDDSINSDDNDGSAMLR